MQACRLRSHTVDVTPLQAATMAEWRNGVWNGGMVEWQEWQPNGGMAEWQNGGMADGMTEWQKEWQNG